MSPRSIVIVAVFAATFAVVGAITRADQDRQALRVPDGLAFSDFNGYEAWQDIAVSVTRTSVKAILGNAAMIQAYRDGIPGNGKAFPDGARIVKIEWLKKENPNSQYPVEVPDTLKSLSFMERDSKKYPSSHGWAYAQFAYDSESHTLKPSVTGTACGDACHIVVASQGYVFTAYPPR